MPKQTIKLQRRIDERERELASASKEIMSHNSTDRERERSRMLLRQFLDDSPIGIAVVSARTKERLLVNNRMVEMFGAASKEELRRRNITESWVDLSRLEQSRDVFENGEDLVDFEAERRRVDGSTWWVLLNSQPIEFEGEPARVIWHYDITERKKAQEQARAAKTELEIRVNERTRELTLEIAERKRSDERFKDFAGAASDWFWEMGPDLKFTFHSARYFEITGFRPEDKIGTTRTRYVDPSALEDEAEKWAVHMADLEARRPFKNFEYAFKALDGRIINARTSGTPVFDKDGTFKGYRGTGTDITERKRAEEAAAKAHELLIDAIEALSDGFVLYDSDDRMVLSNSKYRELHPIVADKMVPGVNIEDLLRTAAARGQHPEAMGRVEEWVQERMDLYRNPRDPIEQQLASGGWLRVYERPTKDGGVVGIRTDITTLKEREHALRESEERFKDFADASSDYFWEMDENLRFSYFSERFSEVTGVPAERLIGKTRQESRVGSDVDPEIYQQHLDDLAAHRPFRNFIHPRILPDGTVVHLSISGTPVFDEDGNFKGYRGTGTDITERKRAEAAVRESEIRLRAAVESLSDAFALFDLDDRLVFCNHMFKVLNPELASKILPGMTFEDMLRDNIKHGRIVDAIGREEEYVRERMAQHRDPGEPTLSRRADGRWLLLREKRSPDGSTFLVNTDMTELKNRENALREEKEKAEQASRFKSQFLATMSHELRTPLNAIIGFSEILQREMFGVLGDRRYRGYAEDIFFSGQHLLDLINDVLDLSRIEAGQYELSFAEVNIGGVVKSSCDVLKEEAKSKGLRIRTSIAKNSPTIRADGRAMRQILLNLLSNAVKFTPAGGEVRVCAAQDSKGRVNIVVADTGVGVAEKDIETILTPFSQLATNNVTKEGGTGLGLSIVNALIDLHGGTLDIASKVGEGTRVTVRFPECCVIERPLAYD